MAEQDPNAAKGETPVAGAGSPATDAETTSLPDQPGADVTSADQNPELSEAAKQPELANPTAGTAHTPTVAEENAPSTDEPVATPLPSANKPDMEPTGPEKRPKAPAKAADEAEAKPARAKKEKAPALEDKPFTEFINQDFLPSLQKTLSAQGVKDLNLKFEKRSLPVKGIDNSDYWQVLARWGGKQFVIGFVKEDINGSKVFCCADRGSTPSVLESFMIDERKVSLDLLLHYTVQRLNGEKWLTRN